jgi:RNA recognition motif-containing protein
MRTSDGPSKLFVAGLGDNRKSDLDRVFSKYGEILSIYVDDKKQFAFVEYTSSTHAQEALHRVNHMKINGSRLRVEYAKSEKVSRDIRRSSSRERSTSSNVYNNWQVGFISRHMTEQ